MKNLIFYLTLILGCGMVANGCEDLIDYEERYRTITGTVKEAVSGNGISGIEVKAYEDCWLDLECDGYDLEKTNADGRFFLSYYGYSAYTFYVTSPFKMVQDSSGHLIKQYDYRGYRCNGTYYDITDGAYLEKEWVLDVELYKNE